jgi:NAD-dependent deacetylase
LRCGERASLQETLARIEADAERVPRCSACQSALKPDVVLFGELLSAAALGRAQTLCEGADLLLCIGSSLEVHPVAGLPALTRRAGGELAIITQGPTPLDDVADVRLRGDVVSELQELLSALDAA